MKKSLRMGKTHFKRFFFEEDMKKAKLVNTL